MSAELQFKPAEPGPKGPSGKPVHPLTQQMVQIAANPKNAWMDRHLERKRADHEERAADSRKKARSRQQWAEQNQKSA